MASFIKMLAYSLKKKRNACFLRLRKTFGLDNPCKFLENLFTSLVSPILLCCSEVCNFFDNSGEISNLEKFHIRFIKEFLCLDCKSIHVACRTEIERLHCCQKYYSLY